MPGVKDRKARLAAAVSRSKVLQKMYRYIDDNNVWWYSDFVDHCMDNESEWFELLARGYSRAVSSYIKKRAMRISEARRKKFEYSEI